MVPGDHERDEATGRPVRGQEELIRELSEDKLVEELLVAAMARNRRRIERFDALLAERDRRTVSAPLLVVVTGSPRSGTGVLASALARCLRVAVLSRSDLVRPLTVTLRPVEGIEPLIGRAAHAALLELVDAQLRAGVSVVVEGEFVSADAEMFRRLIRAYETLRIVHVDRRAGDGLHDPRVSQLVELPGERIDVDLSDADIEELAKTLTRPKRMA